MLNMRNSSTNGVESTLLHSLRGAVLFDSPTVLFLDVDTFLGISFAICSIMYKLGRLCRIRLAVTHDNGDCEWFWPDFEADVLDLEICIEQQLWKINKK